MKKIALSLFTVLLFGNSAFAQFKLPAKTLLNTNRLERMIVTPSTLNTIRAWVPSRFVAQKHINLNTV
ncbi:MAG: hypothetical protein J6Q05_02960, partial [Elusimicrobiaceae bacterium]|nr:hypothetical protein [Elusimicrobiaceae bacterium]